MMRTLLAGDDNPFLKGDMVLRCFEEQDRAARHGKYITSAEAMRAFGFRKIEEQYRFGGQFRAAGPLSDKAQVMIDNAVVRVGLSRLTVAADVIAAGLVYPLADPLSITQLEYNKVNKVNSVRRVMNPSARGENVMQDMTQTRTPIYLTLADANMDIRALRMSQRVGLPLDTSLIGAQTRGVNEAIEDAIINGPTTLDGQALTDAGYTAYGLLNEPNVNTKVLTSAAWSTAPVGATVFTELEAMKLQLQGDKKFGPYTLYVGTTVGNALDADYDVTSPSRGLTIRERLLKIEGLTAIRTADFMPATKVVLVQMTDDVVDMIVGQYPTVIPWTSLDGFTIHNLIMAIMIPRVRSDYDGNSGIVVGTLT